MKNQTKLWDVNYQVPILKTKLPPRISPSFSEIAKDSELMTKEATKALRDYFHELYINSL